MLIVKGSRLRRLPKIFEVKFCHVVLGAEIVIVTSSTQPRYSKSAAVLSPYYNQYSTQYAATSLLQFI